jgi:hypothetical protein
MSALTHDQITPEIFNETLLCMDNPGPECPFRWMETLRTVFFGLPGASWNFMGAFVQEAGGGPDVGNGVFVLCWKGHYWATSSHEWVDSLDEVLQKEEARIRVLKEGKPLPEKIEWVIKDNVYPPMRRGTVSPEAQVWSDALLSQFPKGLASLESRRIARDLPEAVRPSSASPRL